MAQHDYVIANQSGAAFRADLNNALAAIVSQNSGAAEPSTTYAYMPWADTSNGLFKIRNAANSDWITLYQLDGEWDTIALEDGTALAPSLYFKDSGTDTGIYSPAADNFAITTAGVERVNFKGATEVVFNDGGADVDFRIEGDTEPNLFKIDAGTDQVQVANLNGGPLAGTRNRIINGDMRIDQRNAGASVTPTADSTYTLDRWSIRNFGGSGRFSIQRSTASVPAGFSHAAVLTVTTADATNTSAYSLCQRIEGFNSSDLGLGSTTAKNISVSFWVRSSLTGTYCVALRNNAATESYVAEYTISAADTWEYKTVTLPTVASGTWEVTDSIGIILDFTLGSNSGRETTAGAWQSGNFVGTSNQTEWIGTSGATFYIAGVQLEAGSVATPFERRSYGQELSLCKRYAQWIAYSQQFLASAGSEVFETTVSWSEMRATPTAAALTADPYTANSGVNDATKQLGRLTPYGGSAILVSSASGSSSAIGFRSLLTAEL